MNNQSTPSKLGALSRSLSSTLISAILPAILLLHSIPSSNAGSATWNLNPTSGNWNTAANWTPATVPNGPADTATFDSSNTTDVSTSGSMYGFTEVNGIVFGAGAPAFTIHVNDFENAPYFALSGTGVTNNSSNVQTLILEPAHEQVGGIVFSGNATAANLQILDLGSDFSESNGSSVVFTDSSTASDALVTMNGSPTTEVANSILFYGTSSAGNAILVVNAGIGYGTGGDLDFLEDSTGGAARVELFGNDSGSTYQYGTLNIYAHNGPGVTVGSLEGSGFVSLGYNTLTVGSNNLSTTFSGVISDVGGSGSLTKIGSGTLTLTGANTYTGGTTIEDGKLVVNNRTGSGTGAGGLQVDAGTLGGRGTIAGLVSIGTGSGAGAVLAPGRRGGKPGPLTIQSGLIFNSDATFNCGLNTKGAVADQVVANGVTINGGQFSFVVRGRQAIPPGTVFTVIDNTAATPISGTFTNLVDGSTFVARGNTFQANYEGGDGNDLTLTVQ